MELSIKRVGLWRAVFGVAGAAFLACTACCLPLVAPLLAWAGVASLTLLGPYGILAAALGAAAIALVLMQRRRQRRRCQAGSSAPSTCNPSCATSGHSAVHGKIAPDTPAPIACTLSASDFKARALWLSALTARALLSHRVDGLTAHLTYRLDAAEDVEKMVAQEQACCAFLHFELRRTAVAVELMVTAPPDAGPDARALFAHLIPAEGTDPSRL